MGFNNLGGPFSLAPGNSIFVWMWYGGGGRGQQAGDDRGAQWIMADPVKNEEGALKVSDFTKNREFWTDYDPQNNVFTLDLTRTVVSYSVTVTNVGANPVLFTMQGGGNT